MPGDESGVQGRSRGAGPAVACQQVGEQRQPVRHPGERALRPEVADASPGEVDPRPGLAGPAVENQSPLAVVGKAIPVAQLAQLGGSVPQLSGVVAHLVSDGAIGQRHRQAVGVIDCPGQLDGLQAAGPGLVVVAQQPVGVRRPGHAVHLGPRAHTQRQIAARQLGGEFKVAHRFGGHPEADGRSADGEVSWPAQPGAGVDKGQRAGGRLVSVGGASLDKTGHPQRDQAVQHRILAAK